MVNGLKGVQNELLSKDNECKLKKTCTLNSTIDWKNLNLRCFENQLLDFKKIYGLGSCNIKRLLIN